MKIRNDFVSNSSSCSFIIHVRNEDDLNQLQNENSSKILTEKRFEIADEYKKFYYGDTICENDAKNLEIGDFLRIDIGEDSEFTYGTDPYAELQDIAENLDKGYGKLQFYVDNDAHVTLGDEYKD